MKTSTDTKKKEKVKAKAKVPVVPRKKMTPSLKKVPAASKPIRLIQHKTIRAMFHHYGSVYKTTTGNALLKLVERDAKQVLVMALTLAASQRQKILQPEHLQKAVSYYSHHSRPQPVLQKEEEPQPEPVPQPEPPAIEIAPLIPEKAAVRTLKKKTEKAAKVPVPSVKDVAVKEKKPKKKTKSVDPAVGPVTA